MASLDNYTPFSVGMTANQARDALWAAYGIKKTIVQMCATYVEAESEPRYADISDKSKVCFWFQPSTNRLFRALTQKNVETVVWMQVN